MNTNRITLSIISVLLVLALAACSQTASAASTTSIGAADAGKTISLQKGDSLTVTLDGNATTGYTWQAQPTDPAILKQVGEATYTSKSKELGAPGKVSITFQAVKTGQSELVLNYMRPFEKNSAPLNTFKVTVVVK